MFRSCWNCLSYSSLCFSRATFARGFERLIHVKIKPKKSDLSSFFSLSSYLFVLLVLFFESRDGSLDRIVGKLVEHQFLPSEIVVDILCGSLWFVADGWNEKNCRSFFAQIVESRLRIKKSKFTNLTHSWDN